MTTLPLLLLFFLILATFSSSSSAHDHHHSPRLLDKFSHLRKSPPQAQQYQYETRYFTQRLDHYSFADLSSFQQKYLINTQHWFGPSRKAPIFFYCGNEGNIEWFAANTGFVWEIAPRFSAMVIFPKEVWKPPGLGFVKLNFDAAFNGNSAWAAVLARNHEGNILYAWTDKVEASDAYSAEALALLNALLILREKKSSNIIVEGDTMNVILAVKGQANLIE